MHIPKKGYQIERRYRPDAIYMKSVFRKVLDPIHKTNKGGSMAIYLKIRKIFGNYINLL